VAGSGASLKPIAKSADGGTTMRDASHQLPTFRSVLASIDDQPNHWLFLPASEDWHLDSPCAVLTTDDLEPDEEIPAFAREHDLTCALDVAAVQDVVSNASQQLGTPTIEQLFDAFLYYYDNDAFKDFGSLYGPRSQRS
jgi:hypothetical protein